jgi:uncharacterized protein (TIGR02646 family)
MIKLTKDLTSIPISLLPAFEDLFTDRVNRNVVPIPFPARKTHTRRMELINTGAYNDTTSYNSRYKRTDIKIALNNVYKGKCAFCEQAEELTHVEHYRPKQIYYWLAYSWDNLLISCPTCNTHKSTNFDCDGTQETTFDSSEANLRIINSSSATYDLKEIPKMVNPEITDPLGKIHFEKNGLIRSDNPRFEYTIEKCKIDRKSLNDSRRSLLDRFKEHIRDAFITNTSENDQKVAITTNIRNFISDSQNDLESFLAFRRYAIDNGWLNDIIKEVN